MTLIQQNTGWTLSRYGRFKDKQVFACADNRAKVITADILLKEQRARVQKKRIKTQKSTKRQENLDYAQVNFNVRNK